MIAGADLDHVAVALERWSDAWPQYVGALGGEWMGGGPDPGFAWGQIKFANEMRLELLEPHEPERNDFLRRFLDRSGPGPHHLTFRVPDLVAGLAMVEAAGYRPVGVNLENPSWKEAFLHPKDGPGVVVQLAQSDGAWDGPDVADIGVARGAHRASLDRIAHAVADLDDGLRLFQGLLGGGVVDAGDDEFCRWVELAWMGPGRVRLVAPAAASSPVATWLADRGGRVHHLAFTVPGLDRAVEVPPADNFGVRLLLSPV
ncbi:MAG: VOC family protein [Actinobacteria bacterium]|nr:VOC family protein [Actinomycetota bacterium]